MTPDFEKELAQACSGRTAILAMGNRDLGDDGAGVELGRLLEKAGVPSVFHGNNFPERHINHIIDTGFDQVLFLDAVNAGFEPGTAMLLDSEDLLSRYPQVSTHKMSLGSLAALLKGYGLCNVTLLGIEAGSLRHAEAGLTPPVRETVNQLADAIAGLCASPAHRLEEAQCP